MARQRLLRGYKLLTQSSHPPSTSPTQHALNLTMASIPIYNNKKPGLLIVVMAGAKGIKGKDFSILELAFEIKKGLNGNNTTQIKLTEIQLMSDKLKNIKCTVKINPITMWIKNVFLNQFEYSANLITNTTSYLKCFSNANILIHLFSKESPISLVFNIYKVYQGI